ncbi:hypothetical protein ACIQU4_15360 [Streptomyces sp. NPDC090741]|uniref:hypothetical protein n=1 Tax=Streptomyces sp. NPDC090741 TaxID=3365967 RepID=UPI0038169A47
MTAGETAIACIGAAGLLALAALAASWAFDRWHKPRTTRRFQRTARQAARTEATVANDVAAAKKDRLKQAADDLADCLAIWDATQHDIPHQTRRTEEDQ